MGSELGQCPLGRGVLFLQAEKSIQGHFGKNADVSMRCRLSVVTGHTGDLNPTLPLFPQPVLRSMVAGAARWGWGVGGGGRQRPEGAQGP